jgi:hypothetical protein
MPYPLAGPGNPHWTQSEIIESLNISAVDESTRVIIAGSDSLPLYILGTRLPLRETMVSVEKWLIPEFLDGTVLTIKGVLWSRLILPYG